MGISKGPEGASDVNRADYPLHLGPPYLSPEVLVLATSWYRGSRGTICTGSILASYVRENIGISGELERLALLTTLWRCMTTLRVSRNQRQLRQMQYDLGIN